MPNAQTAVAGQLPLLTIGHLNSVPYDKDDDWQQRFNRFHLANPHIYNQLREVALWLKRRNKRVGIRLLWEQIRWSGLQTNDEPFKLNNNYTPFYARMLMENEADLDGYFQVRNVS